MKIDGIISLRKIKREPFRDVVYEWEDDFIEKNYLQISLKKELLGNSTVMPGLSALTKYINSHSAVAPINCKKKVYIAFITIVTDFEYILYDNCIPIFLDLGLANVDWIIRKFKNGRVFCVTSLDIYREIKRRDENLKMIYMPLMISTKWANSDRKQKTIDIVQVGRKNDKLHEYALRYVTEHPDMEYVYSDKDGTSGALLYYSSKRGCIGKVETRNDYMNLLRNSHFTLVSSPGIDSPSEWVKGIDFPTPRFYESVVAGCKLLARYTKNDEFMQQKICDISTYIDSYEDMKKAISEDLNNKDGFDRKRKEFVAIHTTDQWFSEFLLKIGNFFK